MSSDDESFATVRIVAKKIDQNVTYYLMEWEDEIAPGDSWFPAEDCPKVLIAEFEKGLKSTPPINKESLLDSVASRQLEDAGNRDAEVSSYTSDELWSPDVSQDDLDPNDGSGSSSDSDCDMVDESKQGSDTSKADEQHPPDEDTDANATAANSSVNLSRIEFEDEIVPKQDTNKSKPDETHPTDESSRTNHEEPRYVARKTVPYTTDELWSPDVSQDDLDPNDGSGSSSDSDCDMVDDLIAQKHPAKDLEIIGAAPLGNNNELGLKLCVKLKKSDKTLWFDSKKFGAAWPQVYIDYLERHKKMKEGPDKFSVKNLKKVSLG